MGIIRRSRPLIFLRKNFMEFYEWQTIEKDVSCVKIRSSMEKSVKFPKEEQEETQLEQETLQNAISFTRASVTHVPAAIMTEEIEPIEKQLSNMAEPVEKILEPELIHQSTNDRKRKKILANIFRFRGKTNVANTNNNSLSLSDIVSAAKSKSKKKSSSVKIKASCNCC